MVEVPDWADQNLSSELPVLRVQGEGQELEYIESFPAQARDLGKEIAAFATSNSGLILLGVRNSGDLCGLEDAKTLKGRDQLLRRLEGICRGTVKPAITPTAKFAVEEGNVVLAVTVPKGSQPIYYCGDIPYLRHITEARPAEPHEVIELVLGQRSSQLPLESRKAEESVFLSNLWGVLLPILILGEELDQRALNPWRDLLVASFGSAADELRQLAATQTAVELGLPEKIEELATHAEQVSTHVHTLGKESWDTFSGHVEAATEKAKELKKTTIAPSLCSHLVLEGSKELLIEQLRRLRNLQSRAESILQEGRINHLLEEASEIGYSVLLASHEFVAGDVDVQKRLLQIGHDLHTLQTIRIYLDGGRSVRQVIEKVSTLTELLASLAENL